MVTVAALVVVLAMGCGTSESAGDGKAERGNSAREVSEQESVRREQREASPVEMVRVAYKKTLAETAKVSSRMEMSGSQGSPSMDMEGEGVVDFGAGTTQMTMRMPSAGAGLPGLGKIEMRQIDNLLYQKMPRAMRTGMPEGKTWIRTDLDALMREQYGTSTEQMQAQNGTNDLTGQLDALRGVSNSVEEIGQERMRGVQTEHYRAEIDLEKATGESEAAKRAYEQMRKQLGDTEVPVEVWIDRDGLLRRFEMTMTMKMPEQAGSGDFTASFVQEYYDFGTPVNVQPPPAEKTIDFDQISSEQQVSSQPDA